MAVHVYQYPKCSTCRKALKWLDEQGVAYESVHIVDAPPSAALLKSVLKRGIPLRSLFNTSGESYRNGGFKDKLASMSEAAAIAALTADGKLIKRPLLVSKELALVGFSEPVWLSALAPRKG
jgi:arsenate reductase